MKKVLVSGYIGFNNFGDEAIFYALSTHLKSLGIEVSVLCHNKNKVRTKYSVKTYNYLKPFQILKAIFSCDILISGGGSLLQNKTSNKSLIYYLSIIFLAKLFFKKVIIFAQGIEPINGKSVELITKLILKTCDFVSVRDNKSLNLLKSWNIDSTLVSDPVYSLVQDEIISDKKNGILIQLRDFKGFNKEFLDILANAMIKYKNEKISVISFQDDYDKDICLEFINKLKSINIDAEFISGKSIDETIKIINNAKYIISARLHGLIVSNALKTNSLALIYDEKIKTICDELNIQSIDLRSYTKESCTDTINKFFSCQNKINSFKPFNWDYFDKIFMI